MTILESRLRRRTPSQPDGRIRWRSTTPSAKGSFAPGTETLRKNGRERDPTSRPTQRARGSNQDGQKLKRGGHAVPKSRLCVAVWTALSCFFVALLWFRHTLSFAPCTS